MFKFKASDLPEILTRWIGAVIRYSPERKPGKRQMRIWSRRTRKGPFMEPDEYTNLIVAPKDSSSASARSCSAGKQREDLYRHQRAVFVILAGRRQDPVRSAARDT